MTSKQEKMNSALKTFSLYKDLEPFKVFYIYFLKKPFLKKILFITFRERGRVGEWEISIRERYIDWLPLTCP